MFRANIDTCLEAACRTIHLLYETFIHKPDFRTWYVLAQYSNLKSRSNIIDHFAELMVERVNIHIGGIMRPMLSMPQQ
jgi:hypothetical protein